MNLQTIQTFFMWCVVLNGALLVLTGIILMFAGNMVYRIQSRWYPISRDAFNVVIYSFMGLFKLFFIVFNLVPYIALLIMR
jgi:cytochrome b subunit of formate dehydrogenase